jgi:hypothetical protein
MYEVAPARREADSAAVKLTKFSVIVALLSLVGAQALASLGERGGIPRLALVWPDDDMQKLAKTAPKSSRLPPGGVTVYRSVGLDGETTASIPRLNPGAGPLSPCGQLE